MTLLIALLSSPSAPFLGATPGVDELKIRAGRGEAEALNDLGTIYAEGRGVPRDDRAALRYFQQAAERGHPGAWFNLGMFHELGRAVPANVDEAFRHYLKAAERDFPPAQFNVGNMYANGLGVRANVEAAATWFDKAAVNGVPEAQYNLGLAYELGRGVRQDDGMARRWYRRAVAQGNTRAKYNLAVILAQGRGAPADTPDREGALVLYRSAAEDGFAPAQHNLGLMLAEGRGTELNLVEALAWLTLAGRNGVESGARELVAQRLQPKGREEAGRLIASITGTGPRVAGTTLAEATVPAAVTRPGVTGASPPVTAPARLAAASEPPDLQARLSEVTSEVEKLRMENAQLVEANRQAQKLAVEAERRAYLAESAIRPSAIARDTAAVVVPAGALSDDELAAVREMAQENALIAALLRDHARLADASRQSRQEASVLRAQLQLTRRGSEGSPALVPTSGESEQVAFLNRRIDIMRRTIDKLTEESRVQSARLADFNRLQDENERLRSPRPVGLAGY